jgi:hypothetical protein
VCTVFHPLYRSLDITRSPFIHVTRRAHYLLLRHVCTFLAPIFRFVPARKRLVIGTMPATIRNVSINHTSFAAT